MKSKKDNIYKTKLTEKRQIFIPFVLVFKRFSWEFKGLVDTGANHTILNTNDYRDALSGLSKELSHSIIEEKSKQLKKREEVMMSKDRKGKLPIIGIPDIEFSIIGNAYLDPKCGPIFRGLRLMNLDIMDGQNFKRDFQAIIGMDVLQHFKFGWKVGDQKFWITKQS